MGYSAGIRASKGLDYVGWFWGPIPWSRLAGTKMLGALSFNSVGRHPATHGAPGAAVYATYLLRGLPLPNIKLFKGLFAGLCHPQTINWWKP